MKQFANETTFIYLDLYSYRLCVYFTCRRSFGQPVGFYLSSNTSNGACHRNQWNGRWKV